MWNCIIIDNYSVYEKKTVHLGLSLHAFGLALANPKPDLYHLSILGIVLLH